jgi:hypothetical protein
VIKHLIDEFLKKCGHENECSIDSKRKYILTVDAFAPMFLLLERRTSLAAEPLAFRLLTLFIRYDFGLELSCVALISV